jgi:hypothetical protein
MYRCPSIQGIMISVYYETLNSCIMQSRKTMVEMKLSPNATIAVIINVSCQNDEFDLCINCSLDEVVPRFQRCILHSLSSARVDAANPAKGSVKVQVCGVDEAKRRHGQVTLYNSQRTKAIDYDIGKCEYEEYWKHPSTDSVQRPRSVCSISIVKAIRADRCRQVY